jgi:hypothetical protein
LDKLIKSLDVERVYGDHPERSGGWQRADASREAPRMERPGG